MHPVEPSGSPKNRPTTQSTSPAINRVSSPPHIHEQHKSSFPPALIGRVTPSGQRLVEIQKQSHHIVSEFKKLKQLESRENTLLDKLEIAEPNNEGLDEEYKDARRQRSQCEKNLLALEKSLLDYCNHSINQKGALDSLPVLFSGASDVNDIDCLGRVLAKKTANILNFLEHVLETTERHKTVILSTLVPEVQFVEDFQVELKVLGDETHYGGTSAVLVTFVKSGAPIAKVVYKPRGSETECAILELFKQLNLEPNHPKLPEYKILPMESCSYWEYIAHAEGDEITAGGYAASFLNECALSVGERQQAQLNLSYLQSVCKRIGVTDLHYQNVIFNRALLQIVPIDMEVIKPGHATGLFGHEEGPSHHLSGNELMLIEHFNIQQRGRVFRNTPVATSVLTFIVSNFKVSGNVMLVKDARHNILDSLGKEFIVKRIMEDSTLEKYLLADLEQGDVPILSQKGNVLYYGSILDDEHKIAMLEPKEGSV